MRPEDFLGLLPYSLIGLCLYIVALFATVEAIRFLVNGTLP